MLKQIFFTYFYLSDHSKIKKLAARGVKYYNFGVSYCKNLCMSYVTHGFKLSFDVTVVLFSLTVHTAEDRYVQL